jgi:hypothetical protein
MGADQAVGRYHVTGDKPITAATLGSARVTVPDLVNIWNLKHPVTDTPTRAPTMSSPFSWVTTTPAIT